MEDRKYGILTSKVGDKMLRDEWIEWACSLPQTCLDYPFDDPDIVSIRHIENKKWFALFLYYKGRPCINVKVDPLQNDSLCAMYQGIIPGYHMNKRHWITIDIDADVLEEEIKALLQESFDRTWKHKKTKSS